MRHIKPTHRHHAAAILAAMALSATTSCFSGPEEQAEPDNIVYSDDDIEIISEIVDSARTEDDVDIVRLYGRNLKSGMTDTLLQTVRNPEIKGWYLPDGKEFIPVAYDSVPVASSVTVWRTKPLQLILQGCPDMRNIHSYFVDTSSRKAWMVPSNSGFLGETEEGFMMFHSYRYVSDPDVGGRYTFIQVFNDQGIMADSLSLEKHHLSN